MTKFAARRHLPLVLLFLAVVRVATGQEALRYSLAGQAAAEARKQTLDNANYNVKMGPVLLRFSGALGIEVTDNVRLTENSPQADVSFRPQLNTFAEWRVTEKNSLSLGLGIGYLKYINATEYDQFFINPDTQLAFDIYAGDFKINLHEAFSYSADVTLNPLVSGTGSLPHFENTIGIKAVWDLNKAFIAASYDHQNYISTETRFNDETHTSELFTATVGFQLRPTVQAGFELGGGLLDYVQPLSQDNQHVSLGPFVSAQLSEYTAFRLSVGYVAYFLDTQGLTNAVGNQDGFYFDGSFRQRVGRLLTHTLSFGRSLAPQFGSQLGTGLLDLWQVQYSAAWNVLLNTGVITTLSYEHGTQGGIFGETLDRYGAGISLSRTLTKKATGSLAYQFYLKNSDLPGNSYLQNRLVLTLGYAF